jgi:hypothetical protein
MAREVRSEIRDSTIRKLLEKVKKQDYGAYLRRIRLNKVRAFDQQIVEFDFPVTALIGTNGGGKSTILGAAAIAHKQIRPALFFPKSSLGDQSMADWGIGYDIIDKKTNPQLMQRRARFIASKWVRDDLIDRPLLHFGIARTVPAGERRELKKIASAKYKFAGQTGTFSDRVVEECSRILGKNISKFQEAKLSATRSFYVGGNGKISYSEFHFGAGESSVIRMVSEIEQAAEGCLVLIEEIENGLHPVAVRKMVEYLIAAAERRSIQSVFTTHSEDALLPLPGEGIWSSIDGRVRQGHISIEALRAITGRIDERMAVFVEDKFAKIWLEAIIRNLMPERIEEIGVYALTGDSQAHAIHMSHRRDPSIHTKSACVLDGDSQKPENLAEGIIKLPGQNPEAEVFNYVRNNIETLSMQLAAGLHQSPAREGAVRDAVEDVAMSNRDSHLLFHQVGVRAGLVPENIVSSAFIGLWITDNHAGAERVANFLRTVLDRED